MSAAGTRVRADANDQQAGQVEVLVGLLQLPCSLD